MGYPMCMKESKLQQYNFFMAFSAAKYAARIQSNNNGPIADQTITPEAEWRKVTACIGDAPDSVRARWGDYCGDPDTEACLARGGLRRLAELALQKGCGNCQEKVAVAMMWLQAHDVGPLDFMDLNRYNGVDHAFVVVGRQSDSVDSDPWTWGLDAVVCDPWDDDGKAFSALYIQTMLYRGPDGYRFLGRLRPHSALRVE